MEETPYDRPRGMTFPANTIETKRRSNPRGASTPGTHGGAIRDEPLRPSPDPLSARPRGPSQAMQAANANANAIERKSATTKHTPPPSPPLALTGPALDTRSNPDAPHERPRPAGTYRRDKGAHHRREEGGTKHRDRYSDDDPSRMGFRHGESAGQKEGYVSKGPSREHQGEATEPSRQAARRDAGKRGAQHGSWTRRGEGVGHPIQRNAAGERPTGGEDARDNVHRGKAEVTTATESPIRASTGRAKGHPPEGGSDAIGPGSRRRRRRPDSPKDSGPFDDSGPRSCPSPLRQHPTSPRAFPDAVRRDGRGGMRLEESMGVGLDLGAGGISGSATLRPFDVHPAFVAPMGSDGGGALGPFSLGPAAVAGAAAGVGTMAMAGAGARTDERKSDAKVWRGPLFQSRSLDAECDSSHRRRRRRRRKGGHSRATYARVTSSPLAPSGREVAEFLARYCSRKAVVASTSESGAGSTTESTASSPSPFASAPQVISDPESLQVMEYYDALADISATSGDRSHALSPYRSPLPSPPPSPWYSPSSPLPSYSSSSSSPSSTSPSVTPRYLSEDSPDVSPVPRPDVREPPKDRSRGIATPTLAEATRGRAKATSEAIATYCGPVGEGGRECTITMAPLVETTASQTPPSPRAVACPPACSCCNCCSWSSHLVVDESSRAVRNANNFIKSILIGRYVLTRSDVMDLGTMGQDTAKWAYCKPSSVMFVDASARSLCEAERRWRRAKYPYPAAFVQDDFTSSRFLRGCAVTFHAQNPERKPHQMRSAVPVHPPLMTGDEGGPGEIVHAVACQFAMQYAFRSRRTATTYISNVASVLKSGGVFFGVVPDGDSVIAALHGTYGSAGKRRLSQVEGKGDGPKDPRADDRAKGWRVGTGGDSGEKLAPAVGSKRGAIGCRGGEGTGEENGAKYEARGLGGATKDTAPLGSVCVSVTMKAVPTADAQNSNTRTGHPPPVDRARRPNDAPENKRREDPSGIALPHSKDADGPADERQVAGSQGENGRALPSISITEDVTRPPCKSADGGAGGGVRDHPPEDEPTDGIGIGEQASSLQYRGPYFPKSRARRPETGSGCVSRLRLDPSWEGGRVEGQSYLPYRLVEGWAGCDDGDSQSPSPSPSPSPLPSQAPHIPSDPKGTVDAQVMQRRGSGVESVSSDNGTLPCRIASEAVSAPRHASRSAMAGSATLLRRGCKQYTVRKDDLVELCAEHGMTPILIRNELDMYKEEIKNPKNRKIQERMGMVEREDPTQRIEHDRTDLAELSEAEKDELSMYNVFVFVKDKARGAQREAVQSI